MKLLAVTYGTEGDTRPMAALARALMDAGHDVRLLADTSTLSCASALGVPASPLAGDVRGALQGCTMDAAPNVLASLAVSNSPAWLDSILDEGRDADALLVGGLAAFVGLSAADKLGIKVLGAMLIPITSTSAFASPFIPLALPRWLNSLSHRLVNQAVWLVLRNSTNAARKAHGLPPRRAVWSGHPMLYGVSPALLPTPRDYPANATHTGQWVPSRSTEEWSPPADLVAFLDAGEPPIYVGFGSMAGFDTRLLHSVVVGAIGARRALFASGWSTVDTASLPSNILPIGPAPHDWLLPRCAMAVHHGGSGTTHSACAAGVPSVILPFAGDQHFWARRMVELGVADEVLSGHTVSRDQLFAAIVFADGPRARGKAKALGGAMRGENGLRVAVGFIEQIVRE